MVHIMICGVSDLHYMPGRSGHAAYAPFVGIYHHIPGGIMPDLRPMPRYGRMVCPFCTGMSDLWAYMGCPFCVVCPTCPPGMSDMSDLS